MHPDITKKAIMAELYGIISKKAQQDTIFYVIGKPEPISAKDYYVYIYCHLKEGLETMFQYPDDLEEYFGSFSGPQEVACALVRDCEKECAKLSKC